MKSKVKIFVVCLIAIFAVNWSHGNRNEIKPNPPTVSGKVKQLLLPGNQNSRTIKKNIDQKVNPIKLEQANEPAISTLSEDDLIRYLELRTAGDCTIIQKQKCIASPQNCLRQVNKYSPKNEDMECFSPKRDCRDYVVPEVYREIAKNLKSKPIQVAQKEFEDFIRNNKNDCQDNFDSEPEYCSVVHRSDCQEDFIENMPDNTFYCLSERISCILE